MIGPRSLLLNHGSGVSDPSLCCLTSSSSAKGHPDNHQPLHDPPVPSGLAIPSPDLRPPHLFRSLLKLPMPDAPPMPGFDFKKETCMFLNELPRCLLCGLGRRCEKPRSCQYCDVMVSDASNEKQGSCPRETSRVKLPSYTPVKNPGKPRALPSSQGLEGSRAINTWLWIILKTLNSPQEVGTMIPSSQRKKLRFRETK